MAGNASSIKASEAYVTIRADQGNLPKVIDQARDRMKTFAGQAGMVGEQISGKFGKALIQGAIGFAAIGAGDSMIRAIAKEMEDAAANGGASFSGVAVAVAKSLKESFESIPLAGSIVPLAEQVWDLLLGSPMAAERRLEKFEEQRKKVQAALTDVARQASAFDDQLAAGGDPSKAAQIAAGNAASEAFAKLREVGVSLEGATAAANEITAAFQRLMKSNADRELEGISWQLYEMSGHMKEGEAEARRLDMELERLSNTMKASGMTDEMAETIAESLRERFRLIQAEKEAAKAAEEASARERERFQQISSLLDSLRDKVLDANTDDAFRIQLQLEDLGATQQQIAEALALIDQLNRLNDEQKAAQESARKAESVAAMIKSLQEDADRNSLGERGFLEKQLRDLQATEEQINTALALFDQTHLPAIESSFVGSFSPAALDGGFAMGGLEDSSRQTAKNTRRIADAIERNQLTYGN